MANEKRNTGADVAALFADGPCTWNFFSLVRHLEARARGEGLGYTQHPGDDPVRFRQEPTLAFPPSDVCRYDPGEGGAPPGLSVFCFGLLGCNGPMPLHFSEYVRNRVKHHGDRALRDFLDMFHHRMISLYYRAWAINQQSVSFERDDDPFSCYIGSFIGRGTDSTGGLDVVPSSARCYFAGRLIHRTMNAEGLCAILGDYFGTPARIEQFVGQWIEIPEGDRFRLGEAGRSGVLGVNWNLGSRVWDCQHKFRIILGPMTFSRYRRLVPGTRGFEYLEAWLTSYVGFTFDWEAQLALLPEEVPEFRLGSGIQLGYTSWMRSGRYEEAAADLIVGTRYIKAGTSR